MSVKINGVPFEEYKKNQESLDEMFNVKSVFVAAFKSKLPADTSYFDNRKIDAVFKELDDNPESTAEEYALVLSNIILNIGNAARQPTSLSKCYEKNLRYTRSIATYYEKYKTKLSVGGKEKIRHSIEGQFKHFDLNLIRNLMYKIKIGKVPLARLPQKAMNVTSDSLPGSVVNKVVDTYNNWLTIKYYDLVEAVRIYKKAVNGEYDFEDAKSIYTAKVLKKQNQYFYDTAFAVLEDMLKVYDQL